MSYSYETERPWLFTEAGQVALLKLRDRAQYLIKVAGAFRAGHAWEGVSTPDSWKLIALLDRLVELGEIVNLTPGKWAQHSIYTSSREL